MKVPDRLKDSTKLKNRFKYIVKKIGVNPIELGFEFDFFLNGRSITFVKKIGNDNIIIAMNYWNSQYYLTLYRNSFDDIRFSFNSFNKYQVSNRNISRVLKIVEMTKTRGVTGYWYTSDAGYLKFQFDKTHRKTMMACKSFLKCKY